MKNSDHNDLVPVRLIPFKAFRAMISRGEIVESMVRSGDQVWILGKKQNGSIVALRRTYGGPRTWVCIESPMKLLVGMGASRIVIELKREQLQFIELNGTHLQPSTSLPDAE
ncbi:hypothetical protein [Leclercia adecarboxylata]|uniref:hypothetical protein n=1 Tax=Leclercia adecarboxylata TaxID=83655 RepID=UPI0013CC8F2B|nr:hypothetical protein [Leclercia adecarboxylata]NEG94133.1 hypothetical protein [Leclercia adecarboxylata]